MTLQEQIKKDIVLAMKAKDKEKLNLLRVLSGELATNAKRPEKEKLDEMKILRKMSNNAVEMGNDSEVKILEPYLPAMLGPNQIKVIVAGIISSNGFSGMQDMGKVMVEIKKLPSASQIDGKLSSSIVRELLSS